MLFNRRGFLQALEVFLYCALVGLIFWKGNEIFGKVNSYFAPVLVLLLFSTSALICAAIVLYKPYKLFIADKKKEALDTVISTTIWLFGFLLVFFGAMLIF